MTAPERIEPSPALTVAARSGVRWRRVLLFGDGLGLAISGRNLEVAVVRLRPGGASLLAATSIVDFRNRPAADWGAEISRILTGAKESHLVATIVLPREEVIVRALPLAGVSDKDIPGAIELQIDTLHPWAGDEVAMGWTRVSPSLVATTPPFFRKRPEIRTASSSNPPPFEERLRTIPSTFSFLASSRSFLISAEQEREPFSPPP